MKNYLKFLISSLIFLGCVTAPKPKIPTLNACVKEEPYAFKYTDPVPKIFIRIHKDDFERYEEYIATFRKNLIIHNEQIRLYYKEFKNE